jgi:hypothetical protein
MNIENIVSYIQNDSRTNIILQDDSYLELFAIKENNKFFIFPCLITYLSNDEATDKEIIILTIWNDIIEYYIKLGYKNFNLNNKLLYRYTGDIENIINKDIKFLQKIPEHKFTSIYNSIEIGHNFGKLEINNETIKDIVHIICQVTPV